MTNKEYIDSIIDTYKIEIAPDGEHVIANYVPKRLRNKASEAITSNKAQIMDRIRERNAEKEAGDARVAAIEGLQELRDYYKAASRYDREFERAMERGNGNDWPTKPERPANEYPEAEAYLALESMVYASHDVKVSAGRHGIERVRSGEQSPTEALAQAKSEWQAYCDSKY